MVQQMLPQHRRNFPRFEFAVAVLVKFGDGALGMLLRVAAGMGSGAAERASALLMALFRTLMHGFEERRQFAGVERAITVAIVFLDDFVGASFEALASRSVMATAGAQTRSRVGASRRPGRGRRAQRLGMGLEAKQ
jgi:hypothetical protein